MKKFTEAGLVTLEDVHNDSGPHSKYYHITAKGLEALRAWLIEDTPDFNQRDEALLKYKFSFLLPISDVIAKAERSLKQLETVLSGYKHDVNRMEKTTDPTREQLMTYLATQKGVYLNEARIKWTKECIQTLKTYDKGNEK